MNVSAILNGSAGFETQGFARSVVLNQLGFNLQRSVFQAEKRNETPVFDAELTSAMGDNGLPTTTVLNQPAIIAGYAAAFLLLAEHCQHTNPDTGRKPEHLIKWLKSTDALIQDSVDYQLKARKTQAQATAAMLKADPAKRIAIIEQEIKAKADPERIAIKAAFLHAIKGLREKDTEDLVDIALEALVDCGKQPHIELRNAAKAVIDAARKRFEAGEWATVDTGIYTLAGVAQPTEPVAPAQETPAT